MTQACPKRTVVVDGSSSDGSKGAPPPPRVEISNGLSRCVAFSPLLPLLALTPFPVRFRIIRFGIYGRSAQLLVRYIFTAVPGLARQLGD